MVDAINVAILGQREAAQVGKGGHEIDGGKHSIIHAPGRHFARPPHNARQTIAGLVRRALAIAQRPGFAPENGAGRMALLALGIFVLIPRAVVARINDQCVVGQFQFIQRVQQTTGFEIEFLHHIAVQTALGFAAKLRRGINDRVHHRVRKIQHEGLLRITLVLQIINRLIRVELDQAAHVTRGTGVLVILMQLHHAVVIRA